jgi:hypothetical protein
MTAATPNDDHVSRTESKSGTIATHRVVVQGAALCGFGVLIGMIALVLCCYSFGVDFRGEGWGDMSANSSVLRRNSLIGSLACFFVAIPIFWVGFFRITHPESRWSSKKKELDR